VWKKIVKGVGEYEPGSFYKRELPCIVAIMEEIDLEQVDCLVVDSYVQLDDSGKPGLGHYVYQHFQQKIPVIGVAKSNFASNTLHVAQVLRGESSKPLYITCIGIDLETAKNNISQMHGEFRIPTLLKTLDQITKGTWEG
jgi:deoxyribonuclease V